VAFPRWGFTGGNSTSDSELYIPAFPLAIVSQGTTTFTRAF